MPKVAKPILIDNSIPINSGNADFLYNTANNSLYYRNRENLQWVQISGGALSPDPDPESGGGGGGTQPPPPSFLTTTAASVTYLSIVNASATYLSLESASVQFDLQSQALNSASSYIIAYYAPVLDPSFSGIVNFSSASVVGLSSYLADDVLPNQEGNADKFLSTDGSNSSWVDRPLEPFLLMGS